MAEILTPGETGSQDTGNLLDQGIRSNKSIVLAGELLDELLVLVELLQVVDGSRLQSQVLGTVEIVLVTNDAVLQSAICNQNLAHHAFQISSI